MGAAPGLASALRLLPRSPPRRAPRALLVAVAAAALFGLGATTRAAEAQAPPPAATGPILVPPSLLSDATIPYPDGAKGDAEIVLTLIVLPDGTVRSADPVAVNEPFSSAASRAALTWTFQPATRDGVPMVARIRFAVAFHEPPPPAPEPPPEPDAPIAPPAASGAAKKPVAPAAPQEVRVVGNKPEPGRTVSLTRAEVREIPGTFGDPFRAIEIMPGVTPIVSGLPFFFIRGAPPGDVGYFLDGIRVPLLFHVGIGPSVVHPALMDRVDLYPGGYPARFGRFSGGIVAGETAAPQRELHGEYNLRLFDAGALAETSFADGRGTVLLGGRYSYTAALLSLLSSNTVLDYWDYQARATYRVTGDDEIGVFAFGSYDFLGQRTPTQTITLFGAEFHRVDARYDHSFGEDGKVRLAATAGIDRSRLPDDRFLRDRLLGVRSEIAYRLAPSVILRAGSDVQLDSYDIDLNSGTLAPSQQGVANLFPTRTDLQLGGRADLVIGVQPGFEVTPGVRVDLYSSEGASAVGVDPRLATRLVLTEHARLLSAMGVAHQAPAFVVPLPGFQPGGLKGGLQRALQESIGLDFDLDEATVATATVFHNAFFNMSDPLSVLPRTISGCAPGAFPVDTIGGDQGAQPSGNGPTCGVPRFPPGTVGADRSGGGGQGADSRGGAQAAQAFEVRSMGTAYGLELFLKRRLTSRIGGLVSYTLSRSVRMVGNREFVATFDRTHVLNGALAYNLGRNWRAGTRVVFYTGLPKTPDPTDPTSTRLPPFFRVDLRIEKRWQLSEKAWISFVAEWMNATLSKEAIATRCTLNGCESQTIGPITIPSLGVEGGF